MGGSIAGRGARQELDNNQWFLVVQVLPLGMANGYRCRAGGGVSIPISIGGCCLDVGSRVIQFQIRANTIAFLGLLLSWLWLQPVYWLDLGSITGPVLPCGSSSSFPCGWIVSSSCCWIFFFVGTDVGLIGCGDNTANACFFHVSLSAIAPQNGDSSLLQFAVPEW